MADIRINALATTAASTASDDFVAVDGSANGTRKLNAYSPTFGGNLTVSGGTITGGASGMSLAAGGTDQNITLTPSGTGNVIAGNSFRVGGTAPADSVAGYTSIELGYKGHALLGGSNDNWWTTNAYFAGGGWKRGANQLVAAINANAGDFIFKQAGAGAADSAITWTDSMTLYRNGNFLIGTTIDGGQKLQVAGVVNSSGAGYTNSGYQITNTTASRTTGWFQNNSGTTVLRDVTGAADLLSVDTSGNATFAGRAYTNGVSADTYDTNSGSSIAAYVGIKGASFTSNTSGAFIGNVGLGFFNRNSASKDVISGYIINTFTTSTAGSEVGQLDFNVKPSGNSAYNTNVLRLSGTGDATFAGAVTVSGADKVLTVTSSASTPGFTMRQTGGIAANRNWGIVINNSANGDFILRRSTTTSGDPTTAVLTFDSTGNATFAGSIAIGNTVQTAAGVSSTHKVTISIGGSTYYLLATNV